MQLLIFLLLLATLVIAFYWRDKNPVKSRQFLMWIYLVVALLSLLRGIIFSAVLFGILAAWNWYNLQGWQAIPQSRRQTPAKRAPLPSGCPPNCFGVELNGAELSGIDLSGANLREANLFVADLRQANLSRANLEGGDLGGANLQGADLRQANLQGTDLRGAKYDHETLWPTNFDPKEAGAVYRES